MVEGSALEILWGEWNARGREALKTLGIWGVCGCEIGRVLTGILRKLNSC